MTIINLYEIMASSRSEVRSKVVNAFLKESSGSKSETSRYEYNVEQYENYKIVLKRPGIFKKGFDFTVNIRGMYFKKNKRYENSSFADVISALESAKKRNQKKYYIVKNEIQKIFEVENYDLNNVAGIDFIDYKNQIRPIAIILLAIKWLFISEDISYWNWSGRNMFMESLKEKGLA